MEYVVEKEIGRGGMGCVYKARDNAGRPIALKMMSNKMTCYPEYRSLFEAEVEALRRMDHESVVHIVGDPFNDSEGNLYLPMEFVEGQNLQSLVRDSGHLSVDDAVDIMTKILEAMTYVHGRNCIHRDIKPSNIILRPDKRVCIIDFGIAKDAKVGGTGKTVGRIVGTDGYMSPEQAKGLSIDRRTDIYSLGCLFFFLLTGRHAVPKKSNDFTTMQAIVEDNIPAPSTLVPGIPPALDAVVRKAVDKNMTKRYQTVAEFRMDLQSKTAPETAGAVVRIGKSADNDIVIDNTYVSRHHLQITGTKASAKGSALTLVIEDSSSNGTSIDGMELNNTSAIVRCCPDSTGCMTYQVVQIGTRDVSRQTTVVLTPVVRLAGIPECQVDWARVLQLLISRGWSNASVPVPGPQQSDSIATLLMRFFASLGRKIKSYFGQVDLSELSKKSEGAMRDVSQQIKSGLTKAIDKLNDSNGGNSSQAPPTKDNPTKYTSKN